MNILLIAFRNFLRERLVTNRGVIAHSVTMRISEAGKEDTTYFALVQREVKQQTVERWGKGEVEKILITYGEAERLLWEFPTDNNLVLKHTDRRGTVNFLMNQCKSAQVAQGAGGEWTICFQCTAIGIAEQEYTFCFHLLPVE